MGRKIFLFTIFGLLSLLVPAQTEPLFYLEESFDDPVTRTEWKSFPVDPQVKWTYRNGGYNSTPITAFDGDTNAILQRNAFQTYTRTLISPPVNLENAVKPMLSFAHAQYPFFFGQDELRLLFRAGAAAKWDTILVRKQAVEEWDELFFNIDEYGSKYLVKDFYVGFCGRTNSGNGVCIDKVAIEEKGLIPKYIRNLGVENIQQGIIPSGVKNIPLIKVYLEVFGNMDSLSLNSISFRSLCDDNNVFESNGFRLYATGSNEFRTVENGKSTLITPSISMVSGEVEFSGISHWLKTGRNYLWLTADIKPDRFTQGKTVDFKMMQNGINVSGKLLPVVEIGPPGFCTIEESLFLDDFETLKGWTIGPDFEIGPPQGFIIGYTRDPDYPYSGLKCLGTDLSQNGAYLMNINSSNAYFATSPPFNLKYFMNAKLHMKTWNGFDALDDATIDVSVDNGATWKSVWVNSINGLQAEASWNDLLISSEFDAIVRKKENVRVRFAINYSDNMFALSGWNIDNFSITGNHLDTDLGITRIISPYDDCFGTNNDTVKIIVKNYADSPSPVNIPVYFALQGKQGIRVYDTIPGPLASYDSVIFKFSKNANFPDAGNYDKFIVAIEPPGDEDTLNNLLLKPVFLQHSLIPPATEKFESNGGFWRPAINSSWECMRPDGSIPVIPESPSSWMESPYGGYANNDISYLVSSCYNLIHDPDMIIELKYWIEADQGKDGMNIQYTTDNGITWNLLGTTAKGASWGWYTDPVVSLGGPGWTRNTSGWRKVKEFLPASLLNKKKVQFRVNWRSDNVINARGAAIDDFRIFPAPPDIGVSQISGFASRCQYLNPDRLTISIKNMGNIPMRQNDTIIAGFDVNAENIAIDTFRLSADLLPGQTIQHTFAEPVDVTEPGNYKITSYTLIEDDPWFYLGNNDTASVSFAVLPNPLTMLEDTIHTRQPDTVMLRPYFSPDYNYLWHDNSTGSSYNVDHGGWYFVRVTDTRGNGCSSYDSSYVELLFSDVGIDELLFPVNNCGLSTHEFLSVRIRNYGTDSIASRQKIAVAYRLNGGTPVTDTLKLSGKLLAGHTTVFNFKTGAVNLSAKGMYHFDLYTEYSGDTIPANDAITRDVEIYGHPSVSLGPDKTVIALSHTLDAGSGYLSYLWDNGESARTRTITQSGNYWVQVSDANQCTNLDTVYVWLKIRDISPDGFASPISDCRFNSAEPVVMNVLNSGSDTIPSGQQINVSYSLNSGTVLHETFVLSQKLFPGSHAYHTFTGNLNMSNEADYALFASTSMSGDMRTINDTASRMVYRYSKPVVNFGLDEIEYVEDVQIPIEAGYSPFYAYRWQDGFDEHLYNATKSGLYHVKVKDTRTDCSAGDTVMVFLVYGDVGVTGTTMTSSGCSGEMAHVSVRVKNLGPSNIGESAPIYVACDVNGIRETLDTLIRTGNFITGTYIDLILSEPVHVYSEGTNEILFYTIYGGDKKPSNDAFTLQFNALPSPVVNFGDADGSLDTILPHVLDAGTGNKSYLWQDGSTNQTFTVNTNGTYSVSVTGQNNCQTIKTVHINPSTGVGDYTGNSGNIKLYPNPNNGQFRISMDSEIQGKLSVKIINNQGQAVFVSEFSIQELNNEVIDVQNLPRGMYNILIHNGQRLYQEKLIIL